MSTLASTPPTAGPQTPSRTQRAHIDWRGQPTELEYQWLGPDGPSLPLMVFLHEGLGSLAQWKDFPTRLCAAARCRGLVYSRPGYGLSTPRAADDAWGPDFMHRQAHEVLPTFLAALGVEPGAQPLWLLGHSDGASIALLYAAMMGTRGGSTTGSPRAPKLAGAVVMAPHINLEDRALHSIALARDAYLKGDLRKRLARYHANPDSAFWGWNDIWLHPDFKAWTVEAELGRIRCPVLAIQGVDDEYGTLAQIHGIAQRLPGTALLELPDCGHSPHKDQPDAVIAAVCAFMQNLRVAPAA